MLFGLALHEESRILFRFFLAFEGIGYFIVSFRTNLEGRGHCPQVPSLCEQTQP
jgi:hypothetical protein